VESLRCHADEITAAHRVAFGSWTYWISLRIPFFSNLIHREIVLRLAAVASRGNIKAQQLFGVASPPSAPSR